MSSVETQSTHPRRADPPAAAPSLPSPAPVEECLAHLRRFADQSGLWSDPSFTDQFARHAMDAEDLLALHAQCAAGVASGELTRIQAAMFTVLAAEFRQRIAATMLERSAERGAWLEALDTACDMLPSELYLAAWSGETMTECETLRDAIGAWILSQA